MSSNAHLVDPLRESISQAIAGGELWLAREHYQSLVRVCGFDQEVYQGFGDLLREMREDMVAGRFYFLSGDRSPEAQECIDKFLERYKRKKLGSIQSQFPKVAQKMKIRDFPEPIQSELIGWGFEDCIRGKDESDFSDSFFCSFVAPTILIIILVSIPVGIWTILRWIFS
jgi:hypothetical protein